jgi:hypothetical protein
VGKLRHSAACRRPSAPGAALTFILTERRSKMRKETMKISDKNHEAIAAEMHRAALILVGGRGIQPQEILIVAHAWVVTEMAALLGPKAIAEFSRMAITRLEAPVQMPQLATADGITVRWVQ